MNNITVPAHINLTPTNIMIIGGVVALFIVITILASMSKNFISWSFSGAGAGFMVGIVATLLIVGTVIYYGGGKIRETLLAWGHAPDPVKNLIGQNPVPSPTTAVLGAETVKVTPDTVKSDYDSLNLEEQDQVFKYVCLPKSQN